jgi:RNA polymerase sigma-70 factor (ECF subfamily)
MGVADLGSFLRCLRSSLAADALSPLTDAELLARFAMAGDAGAFEALLSRHGPLVYHLCQRILGRGPQAEDAFQATFLLLATRAGSIRKGDSVACWLHGVACRVSRGARARAAARAHRERRYRLRSGHDPIEELTWKELHAVLDDELQALPPHWRAPVVLCHLEGLSQDEAARRLGQSRNTVFRRLVEGRQALRRRLTRRGLTLGTVLGAGLLAESAARVGPSGPLMVSTLKAAAALAAGATATATVPAGVTALMEGVRAPMRCVKAWFLAASFTVAAVVAGAGVLACGTLAGAPAQAGGIAIVAAQPSPARTDRDRMQGVWDGEMVEHGGAWLPPVGLRMPVRLRVRGDRLILRGPTYQDTLLRFGGPTVDTDFQLILREGQSPKELDLVLPLADPEDIRPPTYLGVYSLQGDELRICMSYPDKKRPTALKTKPGSSQVLLVLRRDPTGRWPQPMPARPGGGK